MGSLKHKHGIFESYRQALDWDPLRIRLIEDRLLIRDVPDEPEINGIVKPDNVETGVGKNGLYRIGIVVATGPGNKFIEVGTEGYGEDMRVVRRKILGRCPTCEGDGFDPDWPVSPMEIVDYDGTKKRLGAACPNCTFLDTPHGLVPLTIPCTCKPGDRVIYERRKEAEVFIDGVRYGLVYEEQAVLMILGKEY